MRVSIASLLCVLGVGCGRISAENELGHLGDGGLGDAGADADLTVPQPLVVTVEGTGTVTSDPPGIDCGASCNGDFDPLATVTLSAAPGAFQALDGWTGACSGSGPTCTVTMDAAKTVGARFAPRGSKRWAVQRGGPGLDGYDGDLVMGPDGHPIIAMISDLPFDQGADLTVTKLDKTDGHVLWSTGIGTPSSEYFGGVTVDADGNVYAAASISGFDPNTGGPLTFTLAGTPCAADIGGNYLVVKLAGATGDFVWVKNWTGGSQDRPGALAVSGTDLFVLGETSSAMSFDGHAVSGSTGDAVLVRARTSDGVAQGVKHFNGNLRLDSLAVNGTQIAAGGRLYSNLTLDSCAVTLTGSGGTSDGVMFELTGSTLACNWGRSFGDPGTDQYADISGIAPMPDGGWVASGAFKGSANLGGAVLTSHGDFDAVVVRYAANGAHVYSYRFGESGFDSGYAVDTMPDGSVILSGTHDGAITFGEFTLSGAENVFVTKLDSGEEPVHQWAVSLGGALRDWSDGVGVDAEGTVFALAYFDGMTDVSGTAMTAVGSNDRWVTALVK